MISAWIERVSALAFPAPGQLVKPPGPPGDCRTSLASASRAWRMTRSFRYGSCLIVVAITVILGSLIQGHETAHLFVVTYPAAILLAIVLGPGPGIVATLFATAYSGFLTDPTAYAIPAATSIAAIILGVAISIMRGSMQPRWQRQGWPSGHCATARTDSTRSWRRSMTVPFSCSIRAGLDQAIPVGDAGSGREGLRVPPHRWTDRSDVRA
jgi:hypothetical protein